MMDANCNPMHIIKNGSPINTILLLSICNGFIVKYIPKTKTGSLEDILEADYSSTILQVRCRKTIPSVYDQSDIKTMLDSLNKAGAVGIRNYAMVLMAAQLGMRASDICGLKFENLHWEKSTIEFVTQKTGKATVLPLTADVGKAPLGNSGSYIVM